MIPDTAAHDPHAVAPVETTAFTAFGMREVDAGAIDAAVAAAGDDLVCVFFWAVDCFNCERAKQAMLAEPEPMRALGLRWLHANVHAHPELGLRFGLHGVPVFLFFHRGKTLGRVTGWHGHAQFAAAVAHARNKLAGRPPV
ncbi:thioredoxin family protein [Ralstonia solanacearum]|uniref:Thioredoxin family protein n=1 Tax=Ralstonia solanacearum TaxID=305 RepID=A0AAW5ZMT8_RALSL|nr:thioredoxin family protein [Ralstonia solanacearum]AYB50756.1 thioredoxin family protein [Ralstonia solanacearum]AYB55310.1 thioredoxin family protein [Ralstonia solanacearum]MBB6590452.1 thioredoxin family protein [Ralstonia solanacearum]MBB6594650.1 thioredoxin family protein [Ralstonia solanacearum]MDB0540174.1 thioredoxin family protein [Ralstonia solanacearum]